MYKLARHFEARRWVSAGLSIALCGGLCIAAPGFAAPPTASHAIALPGTSDPVQAVQRPAGTERARIEFHAVVSNEEGDSVEIADLNTALLRISNTVLLRESDVTLVELAPDSDRVHYAITLHFNAEAAQRLRTATERKSTRLAVLVDGKLLVAPYVQGPLSSSAMIANSYDHATAMALAERLAP